MMSAYEQQVFLAYCKAATCPADYAQRMNTQHSFISGYRASEALAVAERSAKKAGRKARGPRHGGATVTSIAA